MADHNQQRYWIYGVHAVLAVLQTRHTQVASLYLQANRHDQRFQQLRQLAEDRGIIVYNISREELNRRTPNGNHQGAAVCCHAEIAWQESDLDHWLKEAPSDAFILVLDGIQDPHNLGACLRSANGAGVNWVIIPRHNAVGMTAVVRKVACGAAEFTPLVTVSNLARTLRKLKQAGVWIVGAVDQAEQSLYEADLKGRLAIALGAEGKGLKHITQLECDYLVSIPMRGDVSSLNVSVATGVCLYEALRQREFASN